MSYTSLDEYTFYNFNLPFIGFIEGPYVHNYFLNKNKTFDILFQ